MFKVKSFNGSCVRPIRHFKKHAIIMTIFVKRALQGLSKLQKGNAELYQNSDTTTPAQTVVDNCKNHKKT